MEKPHGQIGFWGLDNWWFNEVSEHDRDFIIDRCGKSGWHFSETNSGSFSRTVFMFLSNLSERFESHANLRIAIIINQKAESLITEDTRPEDAHFVYMQKISDLKKSYNFTAESLAAIAHACEQQISWAPKASTVLIVDKSDRNMILHTGYKELVEMLEDSRTFERAISLAKDAKQQGWRGEWSKIIQRCEDKLNRSQLKNEAASGEG